MSLIVGKTVGFDDFLFDRFKKEIEKIGYYPKASTTRSSGGGDERALAPYEISINLIDRDTISKFVEISRYQTAVEAREKHQAFNVAEESVTAMMALKGIPYIMKVDIDTQRSYRAGLPVTWVYVTEFSVTHRRGIDWSKVK